MKPFLLATIAAALTAALPACTSADAPAPATTAQASAEGRSCIDPRRIRERKVLSDTEIQFTLASGEVWLNRMDRVCPGLRSQRGFTWEVSGTQVCSNQQLIKVLNEGTTCALGEFVRAPATPS